MSVLVNNKYPTSIKYGKLTGHITTDQSDLLFLQHICEIDLSQYDIIYKLNNAWDGGYFLLKDHNYRVIICGSEIPVMSDKNGIL